MKQKFSIAAWAIGTSLVLVGFGAGVAAQTPAQTPAQPPAVRVLVNTTQVKPGMANDYRAIIQNESVPANKKAGVPWRWVFQSGPLSGAGGTFLTVTPVMNYAQFDSPNALQRALGTEGAAKVTAKIQATIQSSHTILQTLIANASLQSYSSTPPPLVRLQEIDLIAGKGADFTRLITENYLPALTKAGVTDYWVFSTSYGGPGNHRTIVEVLPNYADLDQPSPLQRALGQEASQKLGLQRALLNTKSENFVYRLVPELSYGAPVKPKM